MKDLMNELRATRRVSDAEVARGVDGHALSAMREGITMTDRNTAPTVEAPRRGRRLGRRGATAGALAVLLIGGGAAYAVSQLSDTPTLDQLNCAESMSLDSSGEVHLSGSIDGTAASGDDVADCTQIRADAGLPALTDPSAFVYGGTHYVVARAGVPAEVAKGAKQPLPVAEQSALLELESAMDDWVDGPGAQCLTVGQATTYAQETLTRLGLSGWTTRVFEDTEDPMPGPCATIVPITDERVAEVRKNSRPPIVPDPANISPAVFAAADGLRDQVAKKCLSLSEAKRVARTVVDPIDDVTVVPDETATCTRVDMTVGGTIFVTLRGPSVARP